MFDQVDPSSCSQPTAVTTVFSESATPTQTVVNSSLPDEDIPSKRIKLSVQQCPPEESNTPPQIEGSDLKKKTLPFASNLPTPTEDVEELSSQGVEVEDLDEPDNLEDEEDPDDEDDDEEDEVTVLGDEDAESVVTRLISPALEQEREARKTEDRKLLALLAHFDEEQLNRFETFRRATFSKASVRRLIQLIATCSVSQNVVIAIAGMTKVYIGELVEEALDYKERLNESGPLQPKHIREAVRRLNEKQCACTSTPENPLR